MVAPIFLKGMASGKLVVRHITTSKYLLPFLEGSKGPTQSIRTLVKGSETAGNGCNGALGVGRFGLPTF